MITMKNYANCDNYASIKPILLLDASNNHIWSGWSGWFGFRASNTNWSGLLDVQALAYTNQPASSSSLMRFWWSI